MLSARWADDGPWARLDQFLMARRLVEAGARCVTLSFGRWDWHGRTFDRSRENFPMLDQGVSALVEDLHALAVLLPAYTSNFGQTDDWARVMEALHDLRAKKILPDEEHATVERLVPIVERMVYRS